MIFNIRVDRPRFNDGYWKIYYEAKWAVSSRGWYIVTFLPTLYGRMFGRDTTVIFTL